MQALCAYMGRQRAISDFSHDCAEEKLEQVRLLVNFFFLRKAGTDHVYLKLYTVYILC